MHILPNKHGSMNVHTSNTGKSMKKYVCHLEDISIGSITIDTNR